MRKQIAILCLCLLFLFMFLAPTTWAADQTDSGSGPQGSAESLLPDQPPIPTPQGKEKPLYDRYDIPSYQIDTESSDIDALDMWNEFLNVVFATEVICAKLTIYFLQWSYNLDIFHSLNSTFGQWAQNVRDNLYVGNVLVFGIVILCVTLVFSIGRNQEVYEQSRKFLILVVIASTLLSFMTPILNSLNAGERFISDMVFWVYAKTDPNPSKDQSKDANNFAKPDLKGGDPSGLKTYRNDVLVRVGEQFFTNFIFIPWEMAEFGRHPTSLSDKKDQEILKDEKTILQLNPLNPLSYIKRKMKIAEWTGSSVWEQYFKQAIPPQFGLMQDLIDKFTKSPPKYPSMTIGNTPWRSVVVLGSFIVGTIYGLFIFMLAAASLVCQALVLILAAVVPILLLVIFIPRWGEVVMLRWTQFFVISGMYKIIVSLLTVVILFVSGVLYNAGNGSNWGLGFIYFTHLCFVIAILIFHKLLWNILAMPGHAVAGEIEGIVKGTGSRMMDIGISGVKNVGRATAAVITKNPSFLVKGRGAAALFSGTIQKSGPDTGALTEQKENFIPKGFTVARGGSPEFRAVEMENPYRSGTHEAAIFDEMMAKGLNPYSKEDREQYSKQHIKPWNVPKEKKQAFRMISEHAKVFAERKRRQEQSLKTAQVMKSIEEMEMEEWRREQEERRKRSLLYRFASRFRSE